MRIVCDATLAFIKRCNVLSAIIIKMADFRERRACIKFCFELGKTATECYEMLKTAFGEKSYGSFPDISVVFPVCTQRLFLILKTDNEA